MRAGITGSRGLIGTALATRLRSQGWEVVPIVREKEPVAAASASAPWWNPTTGAADLSSWGPFDAIIHLGGEPVASRRWSPKVKEEIMNSRSIGTGAISAAIATLPTPPSVFISASAIGYYGASSPGDLSESSPPGSDFLSRVCIEWERVADLANSNSTRVVKLRTGIVLSRDGGLLGKVGGLYRLGLGGRIGSGKQDMSWIHLDDEVGAICHLLDTPSAEGAFNLTAPSPVTNMQFTAVLGRTLRRPTLLPVPATVIRVALGSEMADETALASQRVLPVALESVGYTFVHPTVESALRNLYH